MNRRDFLRVTAGSAAGAMLLQACGPSQSPAQQSGAGQAPQPTGPLATNNTVRIMARRAGTVQILDGRRASFPDVQHHLYDSLTRHSASGKLEGRLAESWEAVNPTTWRFKLRQGVKFHNGEDWNADAGRFAIEDYTRLQPAWAQARFWGGGWPPSAEVEGPFSLIIKTPRPQPSLPRLLTRWSIVPPKASQEKEFADNPIGTGPYRLANWEKNQRVILEPNPNHWDGVPKIGRLEWRATPAEAARIVALQTGETDIIWEIPYDRVAELSAKFNIIQGTSLGLYFMGYNFRAKSPIAEPRVRRALWFAIDHEGIRDNLLNKQGEYLRGPVPMAVPGAVDLGGFPKRDVSMAKRLLADAGYGSGFSLSMIAQPGEFSKDAEISEAIVEQLKDAGVTVKYEELESGAFNDRRNAQTWDLTPNAIYNWVGDTSYYITFFQGEGYASTTVNSLVEQSNALGSVDTPQGTQVLQQALKAFWEDGPYLWALGRVAALGLVKNIQDYQYVPVNWLLLDKARLNG